MTRLPLLLATLLVFSTACDKGDDKKEDKKDAKGETKVEVQVGGDGSAKVEAGGVKVEAGGPPKLGAGGTVVTDGEDRVETDSQGGTIVTDGEGKVVTDGKGNTVVDNGKGDKVTTGADGAFEAKAADGTSVKVDKDGNVQIGGVKLD